MSMKQVLLIISLSLAFVLGSGAVTAQYPPPAGNLLLFAGSTVAGTGDDVPLECRLQDSAGNPIAGAECTFAIESEPGDDAAVGSKVVTRTTDSSGLASTMLKTGSTPGQLVVSATSGTFKSFVVVTVAGAVGAPPAAPIAPPTTGDGGLR